MRIRAKFTKEGNIKFVGHLDTVRLFQRAIKMAKIPIAYSEGFNPHSKVYFGLPLPVGMESEGEYLEIKTKENIDVSTAKDQLNNKLPEGIILTECFEIEDNTPTLMSQVDSAIYEIEINEDICKARILEKLEQPSIVVTKRNKKKKFVQQEIKPLILNYDIIKESGRTIIIAKIKAGSRSNLSPEILMKAVFVDELPNLEYKIKRKELFLV
ncbi:MAG: hypothetical protein ATN31_02610 [Candidatus Epulonipiscioides saccharophilum]|nr:MAG: hypothetical protein ATN31_02610 [Epulopiscium sp. AS2M-Bin001]